MSLSNSVVLECSIVVGVLLIANDNRYEGQWKDGKKHGKGKFFYLDRGQLYTGVWCDDIPKCGTVEDFGRHEAPKPTTYPLPEVSVNHTAYRSGDEHGRFHCLGIILTAL